MDLFTPEAIDDIKFCAKYLEPHYVIAEYLAPYEVVELPVFARILESKLARKVLSTVQPGNIITSENVLEAVTKLIRYILIVCVKVTPDEDTVKNMLDSYPLHVLSVACKTSMRNAHMLGECMRKFVTLRKSYRKWIPDELQITTICSGTTLDDLEMEAMYQYLRVRSRMYVTMLINCLLELKDHEKRIQSKILTRDEIAMICKSSWFCLFLLAAH